METLIELKNRIIEKVKDSSNEHELSSIAHILELGSKVEKVHLTEEQIEMLKLSEQDIENGRLVSNDDVIKNDY